jgi:hypothetical protein
MSIKIPEINKGRDQIYSRAAKGITKIMGVYTCLIMPNYF